MLKLGTKTKFGKIAAVMNTEGERYYFIIDKKGIVSLMPAKVIEQMLRRAG